MRFSVVRKSDFAGAQPFARLDAEYMDARYLHAERKLRQLTGKDLRSITADVEDASPEDDDIVSYAAIDSIDRVDGLVISTEIPAKRLPSRARWLLCEGDIMVSNVRPNRGAVGLITKRNDGAVGTSGTTIIRLLPDSAMSVGYVFAFLKSAWTRMQLQRRNRGSMYPAVLKDDVMDVRVPLPSKAIAQSAEGYMQEAILQWERFYARADEATEMLESFLKPYGVPPSPIASTKAADISLIKRRDCFGEGGALRIDSEFFRGGFAKFDRECQERGNSFLLGKYFNIRPGGGFRRDSDADATVFVVKQAVLTNYGINWSAIAIENGKNPEDEGQVIAGDILLACTAHEIQYVGRKVDYVSDVPLECVSNACVADVMIIRASHDKPAWLPSEYVAAFLRSDTGRHQVQRCIRGLRGGHVYRDDLAAHVRIPIPPPSWLREFKAAWNSTENERNAAKASVANAVGCIETWLEEKVGGLPPLDE